jgi:hypothetical protein
MRKRHSLHAIRERQLHVYQQGTVRRLGNSRRLAIPELRPSADVLWHAVLLGSKKQCFYSTIASVGTSVSQTRETGALGCRRNGHSGFKL